MGHEWRWFQPGLWNLPPERYYTSIEVPDWLQFMSGCMHYRGSLDEENPDAPRTMKNTKSK
ncbi:MAG: hypothetical protein LUF90_03580 [Rikenellaceae bacterium]|nr:hypothetical protein [Rikenellaceae bacterium]